jgi:hypothetical protein
MRRHTPRHATPRNTMLFDKKSYAAMITSTTRTTNDNNDVDGETYAHQAEAIDTKWRRKRLTSQRNFR